jgi:hypothetical protein
MSGITPGGWERHTGPNVEWARHPVVAGVDGQVRHRSGTGRQGHRHRQPPGPAPRTRSCSASRWSTRTPTLDHAASTLPCRCRSGSPSIGRMRLRALRHDHIVRRAGQCDPARSPGYASYVIVTTNSLPCSSRRDGSDHRGENRSTQRYLEAAMVNIVTAITTSVAALSCAANRSVLRTSKAPVSLVLRTRPNGLSARPGLARCAHRCDTG